MTTIHTATRNHPGRRRPARDAQGAIRTAVPLWENPVERFLQNEGELKLVVEHADGTISPNGPAFTLSEAVEFPDTLFPLRIGNQQWSRDDLQLQVTILAEVDGFDAIEPPDLNSADDNY